MICAGCGKREQKDDMLRFVEVEGGVWLFNPNSGLPGREAYVTVSSDCLKKFEEEIGKEAFDKLMELAIQKLNTGIRGLTAAAARKRKMAVGYDACVQACVEQKARLLTASPSASNARRESFKRLAGRNSLPLVEFEAIVGVPSPGKESRSKFAAVCDDSIAREIIHKHKLISLMEAVNR